MSCHSHVANMSFNAISENNILAKISEFTVFKVVHNFYTKSKRCYLLIFYSHASLVICSLVFTKMHYEVNEFV